MTQPRFEHLAGDRQPIDRLVWATVPGFVRRLDYVDMAGGFIGIVRRRQVEPGAMALVPLWLAVRFGHWVASMPPSPGVE